MAVGTRRGVGAVATVLKIVGLAIVTVLVAYIVLTFLDANQANTFATVVRGLAEFFSLGLSNLFLPADPKLAIALNYGLAALIWLVITLVVVRLIRRIG